jgi:hypothetical protein
VWVVPTELTAALQGLSRAFGAPPPPPAPPGKTAG